MISQNSFQVNCRCRFYFTLQKVTEEKYEIKTVLEEAALKIITPVDPKVVVTITLTSPVMREGEEAEHGTCLMSFHSIMGLFISICMDVTLPMQLSLFPFTASRW